MTVFVTWDQDLIPSKLSQAASYKGPTEPINFKPVTHDDRLVYFAKYTNASLGRVKNLYLDWARLKGPMSTECQELNHLFSQCVDGNRIKIFKHLEDPPKPGPETPPFILDDLRELAGTSPSVHAAADLMDSSSDRLQLLLSRDDVAFSEFELLRMAMRWCTKHDRSMEDLMGYFDFSKLSDEQKLWLVVQLPTKRYIPDLIMNGLIQSSILCKEELQHFRLDHFGLRWKKIFDSSSDRLGRFTEVMGSALELFHRKFIIIKVTNRLTVAMYVPKPLLKYQECVVHDTVRLLAFPHSQEDSVTYRRSLPTLVNYRLYFDDTGLQLYQTKRQDTWIFINRPGVDDSNFRSIEDRGDRRRARHATVQAGINSDLIISIALGKFSGNLAKHMGRVNREPIIGAEIYVISNRDTDSMRVLDKWLDFIDTREVMPLFEKQDRSYRLPDIRDVEWKNEPDYLQRIARDGDLTVFDRMAEPAVTSSPQAFASGSETTVTSRRRNSHHNRISQSGADPHPSRLYPRAQNLQSGDVPQNAGVAPALTPEVSIDSVFQSINWLLHHNQKVRLRELYSHLLKGIASDMLGVNIDSVLETTISFLQKAPFLVVTFLDLGPWAELPTSVHSILNSRALDILEGFCLVATDMQVFVIEPFRTFLSQVQHLSLATFGSLVRHISLVVRPSDTALDMLMGVLELESSRLLVGRPKTIRYFIANLIGVALEHIDEANDSRAFREDELQLKFESKKGLVSSRLRIDSHSKVRFAANDHVQLTAASLPTNSLETRLYTMDALVERAEPGKVLFQIFHPLPSFIEDCAWKAKNCGSFVTSQAMYDALDKFVTAPDEYCHIHEQLMGFGPPNGPSSTAKRKARQDTTIALPASPEQSGLGTASRTQSGSVLDDNDARPVEESNGLISRTDLNKSQNEALQAALASSLTCLWGPPGTGKTYTVAVILEELLKDPERRILVTAPTVSIFLSIPCAFTVELRHSVGIYSVIQKLSQLLRDLPLLC